SGGSRDRDTQKAGGENPRRAFEQSTADAGRRAGRAIQRPPPGPRPRAVGGWAWRGAARLRAARRQAGRTAAGPRTRPSGKAPSTGRSTVFLQVLQERVVAVQHDRRVAVGESLAVGLQAAVERIERRIASVGLGVDPRRLGVAL